MGAPSAPVGVRRFRAMGDEIAVVCAGTIKNGPNRGEPCRRFRIGIEIERGAVVKLRWTCKRCKTVNVRRVTAA